MLRNLTQSWKYLFISTVFSISLCSHSILTMSSKHIQNLKHDWRACGCWGSFCFSLYELAWFHHQHDTKSLRVPSSGKTARLVRESLSGFLQHEPTLQMASKSHMLGLNLQPTFELQHTKSRFNFFFWQYGIHCVSYWA